MAETTTKIGIHATNKVQKLFFDDKSGWIDLELLYILCPNIKKIYSVFNGNISHLLQSTLQYILEHQNLIQFSHLDFVCKLSIYILYQLNQK